MYISTTLVRKKCISALRYLGRNVYMSTLQHLGLNLYQHYTIKEVLICCQCIKYHHTGSRICSYKMSFSVLWLTTVFKCMEKLGVFHANQISVS